ncbi:PLP-dependent aminotransferase family protein [Streptomyces sp. ST2-7A]|nr:PLP-dependent aminotransferase family protein [Streptomyces sp. ST2-7A]MCE7081058.1 PLP-dependent aminotransferase family protein [Streptomyces sp. ST2-7A]
MDRREAPAGGLADWLTHRLRAAVADGRLPVGGRLPAGRTLAADLGVSRGVVTEAYRRLTEDGHLAGDGRRGTVVVAAPVRPPAPIPTGPDTAPRRIPDGLFVPDPGAGAHDALRAVPARVDLTPGTPDLAAFPRTAWLRAERAVLADLPAAVLGYGDPRGTAALRTAVAGWVGRTRGIAVDPEAVLVVSGTAQALGLLAEVLRARGIDRVAVENPGSMGVRQVLRGRGLDTPPIPVDAEGADIDALRADGARAVLLTPAHQFPTGVVLGGDRRRALMRWAEETDGLIVEDDYDAEHRWDRPPVPALRALLPERVHHLGSLSKTLAPGLRIGWLIAPPALRPALVEAKRLADLGTSVPPQLVVAHLMESGALERHLRFLRARHRRRRDAMITALAEHLPGGTVHGAAAGLHLTVTFATGDDLRAATAALEAGVRVHPLSWHVSPNTRGSHRPGLVLGYAAHPPGAIAEGVALLGGAVRGLLGPSRGTFPGEPVAGRRAGDRSRPSGIRGLRPDAPAGGPAGGVRADPADPGDPGDTPGGRVPGAIHRG